MSSLKNLNPAAAVRAVLPLALAAGLGLIQSSAGVDKTYFFPEDSSRGRVCNVSVSPDGLTFVTIFSGESAAQVWSGSTGTITRTGEMKAGEGLLSAGIGECGWVAFMHGQSTSLWRDGQRVYGPFVGQDAEVKSESFYQARRVVLGDSIVSLAIGSPEGGTVVRKLATTREMGDVRVSAFSNDGKTIVSAHRGPGANVARLWNATTGSLIRTFSGHTRDVTDASLSRNGRIVATASWDGTAKVWNVATGTLVSTTPVSPRKSSQVPGVILALFPYRNENTILTTDDDCYARMYHAATGQPR